MKTNTIIEQGFRQVLALLFCSLALFADAQKRNSAESDKLKDGIIIRSSHRYVCPPNTDCSAKDSAFIEEYGSHTSTVYIRGEQLRLEENCDRWDHLDHCTTIYPGRSDENYFSCYDAKYLDYYIARDSTQDHILFYEDEWRGPRFEELPDTATISGFFCKTGILREGHRNWLIHYTDELPEISSPHYLKFKDRLGFRPNQKVPHFIVQRMEFPEIYTEYYSLSEVETVLSVEYLPLHDSLFAAPKNYLQFSDWQAAEEEHMTRWKADVAQQLVSNPISEEEKHALYGHWVYEDEWGIHYLNIAKNPNPVLFGDTLFVKDFMFRKRERSSGTIGNWKCEMIGRTLFHEFGRSWDFSWNTDELKFNQEKDFIYRRATEDEMKASMRECDLVWAAWDMADSLENWGYTELLVKNNGRMADSLWNMPDGEEILKRVAYRSGSSRIQRFLAAEIIFRKDPSYPPQDDKSLLHDLSHAYANALSYDYAPYGEYWGRPEENTIGICGEHVLRIGPEAIHELTRQTLNQEFDFYLHYQSGPIGILYGPRKNDHAALLISLLIGEPYTFKMEKAERNADMDKLREKLKSRQ